MLQPKSHRIAREIRLLTAIITKVAHQSFEQQLGACDLGVNMLQYGVLRVLQHHAYTIADLSRQFLVDPSTLVPVIDSLEVRGLVERGKDPNDRRRIPLRLTSEGERLLARELPMDENDPFLRGLAALGDDRAQQLLQLLRDLMLQMPDGDEILNSIAARLNTGTAESEPVE